MEWKSEYNIGFELIDSQHRRLIEIANQAEKSLLRDNIENPVKTAINELLDYTKYHFSSEERYMSQVRYGGLEKHKEMHRDFVNKVKSMEKRSNGNSSLKPAEVMGLFYDWIIKHVLVEDMKLKKVTDVSIKA